MRRRRERRTFFEFLFKYCSFENLINSTQKIKFKFRRARFFSCRHLLSFKITLFYVEIELFGETGWHENASSISQAYNPIDGNVWHINHINCLDHDFCNRTFSVFFFPAPFCKYRTRRNPRIVGTKKARKRYAKTTTTETGAGIPKFW